MFRGKSGDTLVFGLSDENIERLKGGEYIDFSLKDFGMDNSVVIFYGKNEKTMRDFFVEHSLIGPDTVDLSET